MNIKGLGTSTFMVCSLMGVSASAQQLADNGTFAIGVDRMFGYVSDVQSYDQSITTTTPATSYHYERTVNNFSLLGRIIGAEVLRVPRLSFDLTACRLCTHVHSKLWPMATGWSHVCPRFFGQ